MILNRIVEHKKKEIQRSKAAKPLDKIKKEVLAMPVLKPRFLSSLKAAKKIAVIAEIKRRSPSKGLLSKNFDAVKIAKGYERSGASALSVLTDEKFFGGSPEILQKVRAATKLPILRKDFIVDDYQIWESRQIGADAILLIAACLSSEKLKRFSALARKLGLDCLFEVHTKKEIAKIRPAKPRLVGINNRDLRSFHVDLKNTARLMPKLSAKTFVVSESGIKSRTDLNYLKSLGVRAVLVGESLMKEKDPGAALKRLLS